MTTETAQENHKSLVTMGNRVQIELVLRGMDEVRAFCKIIAATGSVPKAYIGKPDDMFVAIMHGQELGLPPLQALQCIATINGTPAIFGDAALALIRSTPGMLEDFDEWFEVDGVRAEGAINVVELTAQNKKVVAWCMSKRVGMPKPRITWFSVDEAKQAHLWMKKGYQGGETPWCTHPQRMLMWRARGWNLRDNFGDRLKGLAIYEEAQDFDVDMTRGPEGTYVPTPDQPEPEKPKSLGALLKGKVAEQAQHTITVPATATTPEPEPATEEAPPLPTGGTDPALDPIENTEAPIPEPEPGAPTEALEYLTFLNQTAKGRSLLNALRKDCKVKPEEVVPNDPIRFKLFLEGLKAARKKLTP